MKVTEGIFKKIEEVEFQGETYFLCYPPDFLVEVGISPTMIKDVAQFGQGASFASLDTVGQVWRKQEIIGKVSEIVTLREVTLEEEH